MPALTYTPYVWPFVISLVITTAMGFYAYRRRHVPAATTFVWLMLTLTVWTFCYIMELSSTTLAGKTLWASAKYFGSAPGPVVWFILTLQLTKHDHWLTPLVQLALGAFSIVTIFVVFTNQFHHWYWTEIRLVPGLLETEVDHGFYFWIYAAAIYLFVFTSVVLFVRYYWTTPSFYRKQALWLTLAGFVPLGGRLLEDFFGIDLIPMVDNVILLLLVSGLLFALAIFRYGALEIVHIAHNLIIQNINAGIIVLDLSQRVVELNPYARGFIDMPTGRTIGQPLSAVLYGWSHLDITSPDSEVSLHQQGQERFFQVQSAPIKAENGHLAGYALVLIDTTARKLAERQLEALARTDPLTGLYNRRYFCEQAEAALARSRRHVRPLALMLFDIDHFKRINDTYGHPAGDAVLKLVAATCQQHVRATDLLARYGGEEFVCLFEASSLEDGRQTAERLRQLLEAACLDVEQQVIRLTVSIGLAFNWTGDSESLTELIQQADQALYRSKSNGRNQVSLARQDIAAGLG